MGRMRQQAWSRAHAWAMPPLHRRCKLGLAAVPRTSGAFGMVGLLQAVQQTRVEAPVVLGCCVSCYARPCQLQRVQQPRLQGRLSSASSNASLASAQMATCVKRLQPPIDTAGLAPAGRAGQSADAQQLLEP